MRTALATVVALAVLAGSAVLVADRVDAAAARDAAYRARAQQLLDTSGGDPGCGCTADVRARDRVASRNTADGAAAQ